MNDFSFYLFFQVTKFLDVATPLNPNTDKVESVERFLGILTTTTMMVMSIFHNVRHNLCPIKRRVFEMSFDEDHR